MMSGNVSDMAMRSDFVECKHKWVDMEDGSLDQFCVRCSLKQKRNIMASPMASLSAQNTVPAMREKIEVPFYNGSEHVRVSVFKDQLMDQLRKEQGLVIEHFSSASR